MEFYDQYDEVVAEARALYLEVVCECTDTRRETFVGIEDTMKTLLEEAAAARQWNDATCNQLIYDVLDMVYW